jgi:hypothetical protein
MPPTASPCSSRTIAGGSPANSIFGWMGAEQVVTGGGDVPVEYHRAVEARRIAGPIYEHAGAERRLAGFLRLPAAVAARGGSADVAVAAGGAGQGVLDFLVAQRRSVPQRGGEWPASRPPRLPTGKRYKRELRDPCWAGRKSKIS